MEPLTFPVVTAVFAAIIAILQQILMTRVGFYRATKRIGIGDDGDRVLLRKQRRHANLAENSGLMILILGLIELAGAAQIGVLIVAGIFLVARISHAIAFSFTSGAEAGNFTLATFFRPIGAAGTAFGVIGAAVYLLVLAWPRLQL